MFTRTYILGKTAPTTPGYVPEYLVTWLKLRHVFANRFNPPRDVSAEYGGFWFEKPRHEADQERVSSQEMEVSRIDGCRMHFYQDFIVCGRGFFYVFELKHIRCSVCCVYNRFH